MPENNPDNTEMPKTTSADNGVPEIEDAYDPTREVEAVVEEDDPQQPDPDPRTIEDVDSEATANGEPTVGASTKTTSAKAVADDVSDTAAVADDSSDTDAIADGSRNTDTHDPDAKSALPDWDNETSARRIIVELQRIESEVRTILEGRDWRRKRKLGGTRRWMELEEDILTWRHTGRFDETALNCLHEWISKRHYLFKRLRFIAATRPTWNT